MSKTASLPDFLTEAEIERATQMYRENNAPGYARRVCDEITRPNIERINKALGQENDPMYLAYAVEHVMGRINAK